MKYGDEHLSDRQLLLDVDGELSAHDRKPIQAHLAGCWTCRARRQEIENAIAGFVHIYQREFDAKIPSADGPRAALQAQLEQLSSVEAKGLSHWITLPRGLTWAATLCILLALGFWLTRSRMPADQIVSVPDSTLTPGATLLVSRPTVCAQENIKNRPVPVNLQRKVFEEYGIAGADPRAYEVDYLVTPALGGADDIHNLWPHSYSPAVWNARVKDALEDRLRQMVCDGHMDLAEAQQEIAANWIVAYKKYFHTDRPLQ